MRGSAARAGRSGGGLWREGLVFTSMLRRWSGQARAHPQALASLLGDYQMTVLTRCLRCDEQTACWLQLYGRPHRGRWDDDVQAIARDLDLDAHLLSTLLQEAERRQAASDLSPTSVLPMVGGTR